MSKISLQQPYREIKPLSCKVPKCTLRYSFILLFDYNRQGGGINGFKIFWEGGHLDFSKRARRVRPSKF